MNGTGKKTKPRVWTKRGRRGPGGIEVAATELDPWPQSGCDQPAPAARPLQDLDEQLGAVGVVHALRDEPVSEEEPVDGRPAQLPAAELPTERELDEHDIATRGPSVHRGGEPGERLEHLRESFVRGGLADDVG